MRSFVKTVVAGGAVLAAGFTTVPGVQAAPSTQSHAPGVHAQTATTVHAEGHNSSIPSIDSLTSFVNRLLNEENQAIDRNTSLLTQRAAGNQRIEFLESQEPTNPHQARIIQLQIIHTEQVVNAIQAQLNLNLIHLVTTIPGIESGIRSGLFALQTFYPNNPPVQRYVDNAGALAIHNSIALNIIIAAIPASP